MVKASVRVESIAIDREFAPIPHEAGLSGEMEPRQQSPSPRLRGEGRFRLLDLAGTSPSHGPDGPRAPPSPRSRAERDSNVLCRDLIFCVPQARRCHETRNAKASASVAHLSPDSPARNGRGEEKRA
jgi:hypothetical protein